MYFWAFLKKNKTNTHTQNPSAFECITEGILQHEHGMKIPVCITICRETLLQLFFIEVWAGQPTFMVKWQPSALWIKQLSKESIVVQKSSVISYFFYILHINETSFGRGKFPIYLKKKFLPKPTPWLLLRNFRLSNVVVISNLLKKKTTPNPTKPLHLFLERSS